MRHITNQEAHTIEESMSTEYPTEHMEYIECVDNRMQKPLLHTSKPILKACSPDGSYEVDASAFDKQDTNISLLGLPMHNGKSVACDSVGRKHKVDTAVSALILHKN